MQKSLMGQPSLMQWKIPAKTFLVGEYAALLGGSAIVLTTSPCFALSLEAATKHSHAMHPQSPALCFWQAQKNPSQTLYWQDPYFGKGGLGASSAEFIGAYRADCYLKNKPFESQGLLEAYFKTTATDTGLSPSGYDVLAQSLDKCVYINRQKDQVQSYDWAFSELSFLLIHSGKKLATHSHLQNLILPNIGNSLSLISDAAHNAFINKEADRLIMAVNAYQEALADFNLSHAYSLARIKEFKTNKKILAVKGCGALGADVFLLLLAKKDKEELVKNSLKAGESLVATETLLYKQAV